MVAGAKRLGLKNMALANKWTDPMNANLAKFFARGDQRRRLVDARDDAERSSKAWT
jgi:hypothetical protein